MMTMFGLRTDAARIPGVAKPSKIMIDKNCFIVDESRGRARPLRKQSQNRSWADFLFGNELATALSHCQYRLACHREVLNKITEPVSKTLLRAFIVVNEI